MKKKYFINANIIDPHNSINEYGGLIIGEDGKIEACLLYTSPSPRDGLLSRMPSSA